MNQKLLAQKLKQRREERGISQESYACTLTVAPDGSVKLPKRVLETLHVNPKTVAQEDHWMEIRNYDKRIEITPQPLFDFAWRDAVEDRIKRWMKKKGDAST